MCHTDSLHGSTLDRVGRPTYSLIAVFVNAWACVKILAKAEYESLCACEKVSNEVPTEPDCRLAMYKYIHSQWGNSD